VVVVVEVVVVVVAVELGAAAVVVVVELEAAGVVVVVVELDAAAEVGASCVPEGAGPASGAVSAGSETPEPAPETGVLVLVVVVVVAAAVVLAEEPEAVEEAVVTAGSDSTPAVAPAVVVVGGGGGGGGEATSASTGAVSSAGGAEAPGWGSWGGVSASPSGLSPALRFAQLGSLDGAFRCLAFRASSWALRSEASSVEVAINWWVRYSKYSSQLRPPPSRSGSKGLSSSLRKALATGENGVPDLITSGETPVLSPKAAAASEPKEISMLRGEGEVLPAWAEPVWDRGFRASALGHSSWPALPA